MTKVTVTSLECFTGAKVPELQACCTGPGTKFTTLSQGDFNRTRPDISPALWPNITGPTIASCFEPTPNNNLSTVKGLVDCLAQQLNNDTSKKWFQCQAKGYASSAPGRRELSWGGLAVVALLVSTVVVM